MGSLDVFVCRFLLYAHDAWMQKNADLSSGEGDYECACDGARGALRRAGFGVYL